MDGEGRRQTFAGSRGFFELRAVEVKVLYVTNRKQNKLAATIQNLKTAGFPDVTEATR